MRERVLRKVVCVNGNFYLHSLNAEGLHDFDVDEIAGTALKEAALTGMLLRLSTAKQFETFERTVCKIVRSVLRPAFYNGQREKSTAFDFRVCEDERPIVISAVK